MGLEALVTADWLSDNQEQALHNFDIICLISLRQRSTVIQKSQILHRLTRLGIMGMFDEMMLWSSRMAPSAGMEVKSETKCPEGELGPDQTCVS